MESDQQIAHNYHVMVSLTTNSNTAEAVKYSTKEPSDKTFTRFFPVFLYSSDSSRDSDSSPFYSDSDSSPVFFTLTLGLGLEIVTRTRARESNRARLTWLGGPSHARVQAVAAVPCCAVYSDIRYILLFVFMFWKINKCWLCGLLDSWLGLEFFFDSDSRTRTRTRTLRWWLGLGLGLWGDDSDSDSDSEVMTRTRTRIFDNLDSDTALLYIVTCYKCPFLVTPLIILTCMSIIITDNKYYSGINLIL